jgi:hypothetical protein
MNRLDSHPFRWQASDSAIVASYFCCPCYGDRKEFFIVQACLKWVKKTCENSLTQSKRAEIKSHETLGKLVKVRWKEWNNSKIWERTYFESLRKNETLWNETVGKFEKAWNFEKRNKGKIWERMKLWERFRKYVKRSWKLLAAFSKRTFRKRREDEVFEST